MLSWKKEYTVARKIKSKIHKFTNRSGQNNFNIPLFLLASKKKAIIVSDSFLSDSYVLTATRIAGAVAVCKVVKSLSKQSPETIPPQFYRASPLNWLLK